MAGKNCTFAASPKAAEGENENNDTAQASEIGFGILGFHHTTGASPVHQCKKISPVKFFDITMSLKGLKNLKFMACTSLQHS